MPRHYSTPFSLWIALERTKNFHDLQKRNGVFFFKQCWRWLFRRKEITFLPHYFNSPPSFELQQRLADKYRTALFLYPNSIYLWYRWFAIFCFACFTGFAGYFNQVDFVAYLAIALVGVLVTFLFFYVAFRVIYHTLKLSTLDIFWHRWPPFLKEWFHSIPHKVCLSARDKNLHTSPPCIRTIRRDWVSYTWSWTKKTSFFIRRLRNYLMEASNTKSFFLKLDIPNVSQMLYKLLKKINQLCKWARFYRYATKHATDFSPNSSPQAIFLKLALMDTFSQEFSSGIDRGAQRFVLTWLSPIWVSFLYLVLLLLGASILKENGADLTSHVVDINISVSWLFLVFIGMWGAMSAGFVLSQLDNLKEENWKLTPTELASLPNCLLDRISRYVGAPVFLNSFRVKSIFGLIYVAAIAVYAMLISILF